MRLRFGCTSPFPLHSLITGCVYVFLSNSQANIACCCVVQCICYRFWLPSKCKTLAFAGNMMTSDDVCTINKWRWRCRTYTHMPNTCCCVYSVQHTHKTNNNSSAPILIRNFQFTFFFFSLFYSMYKVCAMTCTGLLFVDNILFPMRLSDGIVYSMKYISWKNSPPNPIQKIYQQYVYLLHKFLEKPQSSSWH